MIFGGDRDGEQERYSTWDEAENGHKKIVDSLLKHTTKWHKKLKN